MDIANRIKGLLADDGGVELSPYVRATVERVDGDGTAWCSIPGNPELVECAAPIAAHYGDQVTVRTVAGLLTIVQNHTSPAVTEAEYDYVKDIAEEANELLDGVAQAAETADKTVAEILADANTASGLVGGMQEAAEAAGTTLTGIYQDAEYAKTAADTAKDAADDATESALAALTSAVTALYQLSVVEDVAGTIDWLASHAVYEPTQDATVTTGKVYYAESGGTYTPQAVPEFTYAPTEDAEPQDGTAYYVLVDGEYVQADVSGGFEEGTTYYEQSESDPSALGLYEVHASESVQSYVMSHLALTGDGLYLMADGSAFRLLLSSDGWRIVGADGADVTATTVDAEGNVTNTIGRLDGLHLTIEANRLAFSYPNGTEMVEVAWIEVDRETGESSFHISNIVVMRELRIGSWKWYEDASRNLTLKWIGE